MIDNIDIEEILAENDRRMALLNSIKSEESLTEGEEAGEHKSGQTSWQGAAYDVRRAREDFIYWAEKRALIKNKEGGADIPFVLNPPQRKLVAKLEEMRRAKEPLRLILLKARQWGGSTCIQIYMAWLQLMHKTGLNSLIIAHQGTATDEIKDMFDRLIENYPADEILTEEGEPGDGKKMERVGRSGNSWRLTARKCKIKLGTAERPDACRGGDYSLVHLSEVGIWRATKGKKPEDIIRSALGGILFSPDTMIVLESTANGTGNYFHNEYKAAKKGKSQFKPLFVAWYEIPKYIHRIENTEDFARNLILRKDEYDAPDNRSESGRYLWELWQKGATLEGIAWYVRERAKYSDHAQMAAEYPSDDIEAFAHSGARVFAQDKIEALRKQCKEPIAVGELHGDALSGEDSLKGIRFREDITGRLKIWKFPGEGDESERYLVVVDVGGRSQNSDWSVIAVFDRMKLLYGEGPEIVAQWRGHTDIDLLAWNAARIARYYSNALLVIESNTITQHQSRVDSIAEDPTYLFEALKEGYDNLYMRAAPADSARENGGLRYGFHTNRSTKSAIIHNMIEIVREGGYVERDEECVDELVTYEQRENGSYGAIEGKHDDMLMTRAIGLYISRFSMGMPRVGSRQGRNLRKTHLSHNRPDLCF